MIVTLLRKLSLPILSISGRRCFSRSRILAFQRVLPNNLYSTSVGALNRSWDRSFSAGKILFSSTLSPLEFGQVCEETLDSLADYFDQLVESIPELKNGDILYSDGVITANLGNNLGTYVINRQTPNQQIWLSSPTSGPKRYDFINNTWVYKHDKTTLHSLLDRELLAALNCPVDFSTNCAFGK